MSVNVQPFVVRISVESYEKNVSVNQYGLWSIDTYYRGLVMGGSASFTRSTKKNTKQQE